MRPQTQVTSFDSFDRAEEWVRELQGCGPVVGDKGGLEAGKVGDSASHRGVCVTQSCAHTYVQLSALQL